MDSDGGEVLLGEKLMKSLTSFHGLDKDDDLVELKGVQKIEKATVLLGFLQFDVVLLETMESELGFIVDVDLHRLK